MKATSKSSVAITLFVLFAILSSAPLLAEENDPTGKFDAVAEVTGPQGTRSMPVTIEVRNPMPLEQAQKLRDVLAQGGQQALVNAIRGGNRGSFMLGATSYPIDLVIAQPIDDGFRYTVVTVRNIRWEETEQNQDSLDYPFTVMVFEVNGFGSGEGSVMPRSSISIGDDGGIHVEKFEATSGRLKDVKKK